MTDDERSTSHEALQSGAGRAGSLRIDDAKPRPSHMSGLTLVLWALASNGLLAYVALGSTPAYIWRFGRKHEEFKSVLGTWRIEASNLPRVSQQWLMTGAFYGALIVFLLGVIVGLWFLLGARDGEVAAVDAASSPDPGTMTT